MAHFDPITSILICYFHTVNINMIRGAPELRESFHVLIWCMFAVSRHWMVMFHYCRIWVKNRIFISFSFEEMATILNICYGLVSHNSHWFCIKTCWSQMTATLLGSSFHLLSMKFYIFTISLLIKNIYICDNLWRRSNCNSSMYFHYFDISTSGHTPQQRTPIHTYT